MLELHKGGAFDQITNVSANVKLLCFLASSAHCDQRHVCSETSPRAKRRPVHSPGDSLSRLKSRLTFYDLFIFVLQYRTATTSSPNLLPTWQGVKLQFTHRRKHMGRYHAEQRLGESPESLSPVVVSSLTQWRSPHSISLFFLLLFLGALDIYAGKNNYFSISQSSQMRKSASPTRPIPLIFSCIYSFALLSPHSSFTPPPPPSTPIPVFPASCCFLILSAVSHSFPL